MPTIKEIKKQGSKEFSSFHRRLLHEVSYYLTWIFLHTPLTPNQITVFWALWQFASSFLLLQGDYWSVLLGTFLFQFGTFLDCVDGQVARFRKTTSLFGVYLDEVAHNVLNPLFLLFLSIGVWRQSGNQLYLLAGVIGILCFWYTRILAMNILWFHAEYRTTILKHFDSYSLRKRWVPLYDSLKIEYPFNLLFFGVLLGGAHIIVIVYAAFYAVDFLKRTAFQFIKMKGVDKELGPGAKGGLG